MKVKLDKKKPHSEMCGEPGVKYLQNDCFYDANGIFVRESGIEKPEKPIVIRKAATDVEREEAHRAALARAAAMLGPFGRDHTHDKVLADIERENSRALAAEERNFK